jgi:hypothetical protein
MTGTRRVGFSLPPLRCANTARRKKKRNFFFEKKKQKTFAPLPSSRTDDLLRQARNQTGKSFLVLFFKKEQLSFSNLLDCSP